MPVDAYSVVQGHQDKKTTADKTESDKKKSHKEYIKEALDQISQAAGRRVQCNLTVLNLRPSFFIAAQIAQPVLLKWDGQLGQSGQQ